MLSRIQLTGPHVWDHDASSVCREEFARHLLHFGTLFLTQLRFRLDIPPALLQTDLPVRGAAAEWVMPSLAMCKPVLQT